MVYDPLRERLTRLAERAPAPADSGRTTFRLPPRAADALAWLTSQLRSTQKDVLAGLPDVVDDLRGTELWETLGGLAGGVPPAAPAASAPPAAMSPVSHALLQAPASAAFLREPAASQDVDPGERSTYVLPREALERLTALSEALALPRDEVVARALVALRAAVELRQAGRPEVIRSLRERVAGLEGAVGAAAEEAVALPPHDPIRVHLERAYTHLVEAHAALQADPTGNRQDAD
jgi:hypothetical protein